MAWAVKIGAHKTKGFILINKVSQPTFQKFKSIEPNIMCLQVILFENILRDLAVMLD